MGSPVFGKSLSLKQLVYENLRSRIINGELRPGARLLEGELSKEMEISRAPIREALNMLERDGLATIMPRRGAIVSIYTKDDVRDIWEMRTILEPYAVRLSLPYIPEPELDQVEQMLNEVMENPTDIQKYSDSDLSLHDLFYRHLPNRYMRSALLNLKAHSLCIRWNVERCHEGEESVSVELVRRSTEEHLQILKALRAGDGEKAARVVERHLRQSGVRTMNGIK